MTIDAANPIIGYLAGPTASGKSALGAEVADRHGLAVISADSMQVYRGMEVGTGAIPMEERRGVPHHLLSVAEPGEDFHAARFLAEATRVAREELESSGRRSVVVGGTGMWIQALREGLFDGPARDEALRAELRRDAGRLGAQAMHARLAAVDPATAARVPPADRVRVERALEVWLLTGEAHSAWMARDRLRREALGELPPLVVIDLPRDQLERRIARRVGAMLAAGWPAEAAHLAARNLPPHSPAAKALGYREALALHRGEMNESDAASAITQSTRQYAKRQRTWFRGQRAAYWISDPKVEAVEEAMGLRPKSR